MVSYNLCGHSTHPHPCRTAESKFNFFNELAKEFVKLGVVITESPVDTLLPRAHLKLSSNIGQTPKLEEFGHIASSWHQLVNCILNEVLKFENVYRLYSSEKSEHEPHKLLDQWWEHVMCLFDDEIWKSFDHNEFRVNLEIEHAAALELFCDSNDSSNYEPTDEPVDESTHLPSNGAVGTAESRAEKTKKSEEKWPRNSDAKNLIFKMRLEIPKGKTKAEIARNFTGEPIDNSPKADGLLRNLRNYPHLLPSQD